MATKSSSYLPKHAYPALMNVFPDSLDWVLVNTHVFDHIQKCDPSSILLNLSRLLT